MDKPAGLLTVPGKLENREDCLITRLQAARWDALTGASAGLRHQSGVIIFARTKQAQGFLGQEFEKRRAQKTYIARRAWPPDPATAALSTFPLAATGTTARARRSIP